MLRLLYSPRATVETAGQQLTLRLLLLAAGRHFVSAFLHRPQDELVVRVQVMVETEEVELGVTRLLGLQHNLKLSALLAHKVGRPLDDVMGLDGCRLETEETNTLQAAENTHTHTHTHSSRFVTHQLYIRRDGESGRSHEGLLALLWLHLFYTCRDTNKEMKVSLGPTRTSWLPPSPLTIPPAQQIYHLCLKSGH